MVLLNITVRMFNFRGLFLINSGVGGGHIGSIPVPVLFTKIKNGF